MRGFVTTALGQVHYREVGAGPTLVLIHRTSDSSTQWTDVFPCLAPSFRVIAVDTPGFGDSDAPSEPPGIAGYARNLKESLDALGIRRTLLLGHRTGASIAVEFAALFPDRVEKLVLSGCPDYDSEVRAAMSYPRHDRTPAADGSHFSDAWSVASRNLGAWASPVQVQRSALDALVAVSPHWAYAAVYEQDMQARLRTLRMPVMFLYGEDDPFRRRLAGLQACLPESRTEIIPGANALTMLHTPQKFCDVLRSFLL